MLSERRGAAYVGVPATTRRNRQPGKSFESKTEGMTDAMNNILSPPTPEAIAARAYQLWEEAGRPTGRDEEFWLHAEQQLQTKLLPPILPPTPPPTILQSPPHAIPPVIREVVQPVARPPTAAPSRKRRAL